MSLDCYGFFAEVNVELELVCINEANFYSQCAYLLKFARLQLDFCKFRPYIHKPSL